MGFFRSFLKPVVEARQIIGTQHLATNWKMILQMIKELFVPRVDVVKETFEESLQRLELTEEDVQKRKIEFLKLSRVFAVLTVILFIYSIYLFSVSSIRTAGLSLAGTLLLGAQFFRYHFWLFQLKERRLGCGFSEWFYHGLLRLKK